jgi:hypothetical protein
MSSLVDIHPAYRADIVSTQRLFPAGRQRIETKIHFEARDMSNPPAGPVTLFGFQTEDMLPQLDLQGLQWGFEFQAGDFITTFDSESTDPPQTFGPAELDDVPLPVTLPIVLDVNIGTGAVRLRNPSGAPIAITSYQITSASGALVLTGWNSLDDQEMDPPDIGWEELAITNPQLVGETFANGVSEIMPGQPRQLGSLFQLGGAHDLIFTFGLSGGAAVPGPVNYMAAPAIPVPEVHCSALALAGVACLGTVWRRLADRRRSIKRR